jgi:hypothetical protein
VPLQCTSQQPLVLTGRHIVGCFAQLSSADLVVALFRQGEPLRRVVARCEAKWFLEELQVSRSACCSLCCCLYLGSVRVLSVVLQPTTYAASTPPITHAWRQPNCTSPVCVLPGAAGDAGQRRFHGQGGPHADVRVRHSAGPLRSSQVVAAGMVGGALHAVPCVHPYLHPLAPALALYQLC